MKMLIGIDMGGTQIKMALLERSSGKMLEKGVRPTRDGTFIDDKPAFMETIREQLALWSPDKSVPVGLAAPGLSAKDRRSIAFMPGRLNGLENLDWTQELAWPTQIPVLNDAHAALLGEIWQGNAKGCANVLLLTLGTGIGGAAVVDGQLLRGAIGRAGHFGHVSLDPWGDPDVTGVPGSMEDAFGESTVRDRSNGLYASTRELVEAFAAGEKTAQSVWLKSVQSLAAGMVSLINCFDPEVFLLTGGITLAGEHLLGPLRRAMENIEWRPAGHTVIVKTGALADWAGVYGSAYQLDSCPS